MNKRSLFFLLVLVIFASSCRTQEVPTDLPEIESEAFSDRLERLLSFTVPLLGVDALSKTKDQYLILDVREKEEYEISHIPGAQLAGYKNFDWAVLENTSKDQPILLYCSVGYRSEKMAEKLKEKGFSNIHNLYGSIFEWANQGYPVEDINGNSTQKIHTYNARWSKWVEEGDLIKVW